jgi:hypothetical protein
MIYANSTDVNLTPNVDALAVCGYGGVNQTTGSPVCKNGTYGNADFNNLTVFQKQTFLRWRGIAGLTYRYELLYLGGQLALDLEDPGAENSIVTGSRQWTLSFEAGVFF